MDAFTTDILSRIGARPVLLNDLVQDLRDGACAGRRWRNVRTDDVVAILRANGAYLATRTHGAGVAIYVAAVPFTSVVDGRGKTRDVAAY